MKSEEIRPTTVTKKGRSLKQNEEESEARGRKKVGGDFQGSKRGREGGNPSKKED